MPWRAPNASARSAVREATATTSAPSSSWAMPVTNCSAMPPVAATPHLIVSVTPPTLLGGLTSGHMSSSVLQEAPRRRLTPRQAATVDRLAAAVVDELATAGYDDLTVRTVARRAGVAPATAYTYFTSKAHLVAEVFWRRLRALSATRPEHVPPPAHR